MVTAVLSGPIHSAEYKDLEFPFRSIALRMKYGAKQISDTKVSFSSLEMAKRWLWEIFHTYPLHKSEWESYLIDGGTFFRHGDACIDIED